MRWFIGCMIRQSMYTLHGCRVSVEDMSEPSEGG